MKKLFRFHKKKKKIDSDTVNKIDRSNTYDDSVSNSNNSSQRTINSNNSKSSSNSIDLIREDIIINTKSFYLIKDLWGNRFNKIIYIISGFNF